MQKILSKKLILLVVLIVIYFLCKLRGRQLRKYELFISKVNPKDVWNFVADFSNTVKLNPRIQQWEIMEVGEKSNGTSWQYKVITYESMMGESIFGLNENHGTITVQNYPPDTYTITELYHTLTFRKLFEVENWTLMTFTRHVAGSGVGTVVQQEVGMNCPLIFSPLCVLETDANRAEFFSNLAEYFSYQFETNIRE